MKKFISVVAAGGLVAGALISSPAGATEVPETVQIEDPFGDANTLAGDVQGPADVSTAGDLGKIWFSNDAEKISVHVQTEGPPPATQGLVYSVYASPGGDFPAPEGCLRFVTIIPGTTPTYAGSELAKLIDRCNDSGTNLYDNGVEGEFTIEELPDGTGLVTMSFPRSYSPLLADGLVITEPFGRSDVAIGEESAVGLSRVRIDDTILGSEYTIGSGEVEEPAKPAKAKKPKKPKKPKKDAKPKACAPFAPGEAGADQPSVTVTDAATEEAPVEQVVTLDMSLADLQVGDPSSAFFNIQVDSAAPDAGLYVLLEFPTRRDYDLNLLHPDASYAARAHAWNTVIEANESPISSTGHGGESTASSEKLVGIKTSDCGGWTLEAQNWLGEGGDLPVKLWLGEVQNEPQAEGEEPP
jgi:hypothetical protein